MKTDRQPVYDALDALPDAVFAAMLTAMSGVNRVLALTVMDDPTPCATLDDAIRPWMSKLGDWPDERPAQSEPIEPHVVPLDDPNVPYSLVPISDVAADTKCAVCGLLYVASHPKACPHPNGPDGIDAAARTFMKCTFGVVTAALSPLDEIPF